MSGDVLTIEALKRAKRVLANQDVPPVPVELYELHRQLNPSLVEFLRTDGHQAHG